ncbi:MAG TPA: WhiB family transcriptional regulator [Egibacteraceae bacterium]|nr:WhiB family transcriptional regulator [Egibacteraceae bacterium]
MPQLDAAPSTAWQEDGLCRTADASVFFPPAHFEHKPEREEREAKAKAICGRCPVRARCLAWALAVREPHGVWGGHSERERRQILLGRRRPH